MVHGVVRNHRGWAGREPGDLVGHFAQCFSAPARDCKPHAFARELERDRTADTGAGARHERRAPLELQIQVSPCTRAGRTCDLFAAMLTQP